MLAAFVITWVITRAITTTLHLRGAGADGGLLVGGVHIHHMVFGLAGLAVLSGAWLLGAGWMRDGSPSRLGPILAGVSWALVLDELALLLNLADVYWLPDGYESLVAVAVSALLLAAASIWAPTSRTPAD
jgi:hypothetical protein